MPTPGAAHSPSRGAHFYKVERRLGRQSDDYYDRQRFENYSAWIDNQTRAMQKSDAYFFGRQTSKPLYGFEPKRPVKESTRVEKPFIVQEPSFTSATVCKRKYDQNYTVVDDKLETNRADPYHEPNFIGVKDEHHFGDHRSGSQHPEKNRLPKLWRPMDRELRKAVPEELVQGWMRSMGGDSRRVDPKDPTFQVLFRTDYDVVKNSSAKGIKELNLDSSVMHLPHHLEEQKKELPPPPEPPVIGEDSLLPVERKGRVFKSAKEARVLQRPDERFSAELDARSGLLASDEGGQRYKQDPILSAEERREEWREFGRQDGKSPRPGKQLPNDPFGEKGVGRDVKEILKKSSMLLRIQQHPPIVPRKVFVSAADRYSDTWDKNAHRVRMRYPGGNHATEGAAGTWAPEGGGIAAYAPPTGGGVSSQVFAK